MIRQVELEVDQLVYASVEPDASPRGRSGYQVYRSSDQRLSETLESEIARGLAWHDGSDSKSKVAHFLLSDGRAVVALIAEDPTADVHGRGNRFFAHAALVDPQAFGRLGGDPFALVGSGVGMSFGKAVALGAVPTFAMPRLAVSASISAPCPLKSSQVPAFLLIVRRCLGRIGTPVVVVGGEVAVRSWIQEFFRALSPSMRARATFDTELPPGMAATGVALIGSERPRPELSGALSLDLASGRWSGPTSMSEVETDARPLVDLATSPAFVCTEAAEHLELLLGKGSTPIADLLDSAYAQSLWKPLPQAVLNLSVSFISSVGGGVKDVEEALDSASLRKLLGDHMRSPSGGALSGLLVERVRESLESTLSLSDRLDPNEARGLTELGKRRGWVRVRALALLASGDYEAAITVVRSSTDDSQWLATRILAAGRCQVGRSVSGERGKLTLSYTIDCEGLPDHLRRALVRLAGSSEEDRSRGILGFGGKRGNEASPGDFDAFVAAVRRSEGAV